MLEVKIESAERLRGLGRDIFVACGAPSDEAAIVADELVEASLMGLDSHGVIRIVQYAEDVFRGKIKPGAPVTIVKETPTTAIVDCGFNFGPVSGVRMSEIVCRKARAANVACVVSQNGHHVSRLGAYVQRIAREGMFGFGVANSSRHGHWVAPWGGSQGRLATNPLAYAVPTSGLPLVFDMSTSMVSEGKIRALMAAGEPLPPGCIRDGFGDPSTDPKAFYGPPRGTIQPFGSELGYKGFGLGLLVEILGALLAGQASSLDLPYINGLCLVAINPEAFCGMQQFKTMIDGLCEYVTSCPAAPGYSEVVMPGTLDFRKRQERLKNGVPVAGKIWTDILGLAQRLGVAVNDAVLDQVQS
jgi:hydroxycarboxylate dehydrogenase B